jgi:hypothetical protein
MLEFRSADFPTPSVMDGTAIGSLGLVSEASNSFWVGSKIERSGKGGVMLRYLFAVIVVLLLPLLSSAQCLTTLAPNPSFVPPKPYSSTVPDNMFWFGTEELCTALNADGKWSMQDNVSKDKGYSTKLVFWHRGFDWHVEPEPKLIVTARRLDGDAPFVAEAHANAVFVTDHQAAMMTLITIPTAGCWEVTGHYGGHILTFVVSVEH